MATNRGVWVAIVLVLIIIVGVVAYELPHPSSIGGSRTQTSQMASSLSSASNQQAQVVQESGTVSSVDSEGGHFSIANIGECTETTDCASSSDAMWVSFSSQPPFLQYSKDVDVKMTYGQSQLMFYSLGKVIGVSASIATIALVNSTIPTAVPVSWNPSVGDEVSVTITPETETPVVVITGLQASSACPSVQSSTCPQIQSPTCLVYGACTMLGTGESLVITLTFTIGYPSCYDYRTCTLSVTTSDSGFSVTNVEPFHMPFAGATITLATPSADFVGQIHLTFMYSES